MCSKAQIVEVENEENLMGLLGDIYPQNKKIWYGRVIF